MAQLMTLPNFHVRAPGVSGNSLRIWPAYAFLYVDQVWTKSISERFCPVAFNCISIDDSASAMLSLLALT